MKHFAKENNLFKIYVDDKLQYIQKVNVIIS